MSIKRALPVFVLASLLSGCLATPHPDATFPALEGLTAAYRASDGQVVRVEVGNASSIASHDGSLRAAVPVRVWPQGYPEAQRVYWIDGTFRVLRFDQHCQPAPREGECDYVTVHWDVLGLPAPFGLGLSVLMQEDDAPGFSAHYTPLDDPVAHRGSDGRIIIDTNFSYQDRVSSYVPRTSQLTFAQGDLLPEEVLTPDRDWSFTLIGMERPSSPLKRSDIPRWSEYLPSESVAPRNGLFPGEGNVIPPGAHSAVEVIARLEDGSAEASRQVRDGCLAGFGLAGEQRRSALIGDPPPRYDYWVETIDKGSMHRWWVIREGSGLLNADTWSVSLQSSQEAHVDCSEIQGSPWPSVGLDEFSRRVLQGLDVSGTPHGNGHWASDRLGLTTNPRFGLDNYFVSWTPSWVEQEQANSAQLLWVTYALGVDASQGRLTNVVFHPDDLRTLDATGLSFGW